MARLSRIFTVCLEILGDRERGGGAHRAMGRVHRRTLMPRVKEDMVVFVCVCVCVCVCWNDGEGKKEVTNDRERERASETERERPRRGPRA